MNKLKNLKGNEYVLLFSAGASIGTLFLWAASYIFPEGEIVDGRRVFENIPKVTNINVSSKLILTVI